MLRLVFAVAFLSSTSAWAQQPQPSPIDQALKTQIGELMFNNTILITEIKRLSDENAKLKTRIEELEKGNGGGDAKQKR